jgi:hypothetical protein
MYCKPVMCLDKIDDQLMQHSSDAASGIAL